MPLYRDDRDSSSAHFVGTRALRAPLGMTTFGPAALRSE
jgi:hypothetical protein